MSAVRFPRSSSRARLWCCALVIACLALGPFAHAQDALTADAVNVICDDRIIPAMKYRVPAKTSGFTVGQLVLDADSGAYAAGLTADDTSRRYQVRVLRFRFTWTRP